MLLHASPFLHLGDVSIQKHLWGQFVSKSACNEHAKHLQSRPARKGTHTQGTNSRHAHAHLEPIRRKIGPHRRLHAAATCAGQDFLTAALKGARCARDGDGNF